MLPKYAKNPRVFYRVKHDGMSSIRLNNEFRKQTRLRIDENDPVNIILLWSRDKIFRDS